MKPIERSNRGRHQLDHENRIQVLERRIPVDYPHWYGRIFDEVIGANNTGDYFTYLFPDECFSPDPVECEEDFVTKDEYILFPTGHNGPFHVYMNVQLTGGFTDVPDAYVATDLGANTPSKRFALYVDQQIWRDNAPYGTISTWAFQSQDEMLELDSDDSTSQGRNWWLHWVGTGAGIGDPDTDRRAIRFGWRWNHAANINFNGIGNVSIDPPDQTHLPAGEGAFIGP